MAKEALGYFWGDAKPGEPGGYESLQARRKIAESLLGKRSPYPKNIGEGIASLGENIGDVLLLRDLDRREKAQAAYEESVMRPPAGTGSYQPALGRVAPPPAAGGVVRPPATVAPPAVGAPRVSVNPLLRPGVEARDRAALADGPPPAGFVPDTPATADVMRGIPAKVTREPGFDRTNPLYEAGTSPLDAEAIIAHGGFAGGFRENADTNRFGGSEAALGRWSPEFLAQANAAYWAMPEEIRHTYNINEAGRTYEQQKFYSDRPHTGMVAAPGGSMHENLYGRGGNAMDVDPGAARNWLQNAGRGRPELNLFGIGPGDPGHIQSARNTPPGAVPPGVRDSLTSVLARRGDLAPGGPALAYAPAGPAAPAPATGGEAIDMALAPGGARPSPAPVAPTSTTALAGSPDAVAALPPDVPWPEPPEPNPATATDVAPAPPGLGGGMFSPTPITQQVPADFGPAAPPPAPAALAAAGATPPAMPPIPPAEPAGAPGLPAPAMRPPWLGGVTGGGGFGPNPMQAPAAPAQAPAPTTLGPARRPTGAIERAPPADAMAQAISPLQEPIPPPGIPEIPPEVVRTPRPAPLQMSPLAEHYLKVSKLRGISDFRRQQALDYVTREETARKEEEARRENDFHWKRGQEDKLDEERRAVIRSLPEKTVEDLYKRAQIAVLQAKTPLELAKAQKDLEKLDIDIKKAWKDYKEPHRFQAAGTQFEQPYLPETGAYGPAAVTPGAPAPKEEPFTETQIKAKTFSDRVTPEIRRLERLKNGAAMTQFSDEMLAKLPFGLDNPAVSDEYRQSRDSFMVFGTALMTYLSGASYGEKEMERTLAPYRPRYGDTERDLTDKAERRRTILKSINYTNEAGARAMVEQENFDYGAKQPVARGLTDTQIEDLGPGQKYIAKDDPTGQVRQRPIERIRVK